ncbi:MAG: response regulator, partial [Methylococcaceae bacterium]|nr:response regulator [Methylococcaceae bacterium]
MMNQPTLLVVDDTSASLKLIKDILSAADYKVLTANAGELALRALADHRPDLILLDVRMPDMDGFEVCRRLKDNPKTRDIPVIFLSAVTDLDEKVEGFKLGAVDFISKPFQRDELLARVRTHLQLYRLQSELEQLVADRTTALEKSNRAYQTLSRCNHLVAHAKDETSLLREACAIVQQTGTYR